MSFQRVGLRLAQQTLRSPAFRPAIRSTLQRRYANTASGVPSPPGQGGSKLAGAADNAFNRERAAVKAHAAATSAINAYNLWSEHWEHWEHMPPLEERVEYPYQNIRTRNFFWGDGDKTLFWNNKVNYHKKDKQT
ncbi:cytochrome c oxidase subunit VIa [Cladophialophora carrionii]|uniref:Cytochrome c oxidase subunit VIa n=1 Tax=Cladophialophora carrionii TaxID=86049 RepID=A0A1C1CJ83_9EURO|nr:cytochrome c oxidase subunit VIa [Cladophialophora carrionii]